MWFICRILSSPPITAFCKAIQTTIHPRSHLISHKNKIFSFLRSLSSPFLCISKVKISAYAAMSASLIDSTMVKAQTVLSGRSSSNPGRFIPKTLRNDSCPAHGRPHIRARKQFPLPAPRKSKIIFVGQNCKIFRVLWRTIQKGIAIGLGENCLTNIIFFHVRRDTMSYLKRLLPLAMSILHFAKVRQAKRAYVSLLTRNQSLCHEHCDVTIWFCPTLEKFLRAPLALPDFVGVLV